MSRAEENLVDKYSFIEYEEVLERNRTKALKVPSINHTEYDPLSSGRSSSETVVTLPS